MPVIVFASSKGGAGKTTAAIVLVCDLARQAREKGLSIALVDVDPNQHSAAWAHKDGKPENIHLFKNVTADTILEAIEEAQSKAAFVVVDLEGVASSAVIGAMSRADLVIVPCQPSQNDAKEAIKTIKTINYSSKVSGRHIPYAVLFSRLSAALITKTSRHLAADFEGAGIEVFDCSLIDREAFKSVFSFGGTVNDLEASTKREQASIDKAAENARLFTAEVKQRLKASIQERQRSAAHG
jgi:chromosome partitioning protein